MTWRMYRSFWRSLWYAVQTEPRWFWQRHTRGYDDREVWSIYPAFFERYAGIIEHLRSIGHGYPCELNPEEWDAILTKIVIGFKAGAEMENGNSPEPYQYETYVAWEDGLRKQANEALELFHKWFWHLWS